MHKVDAVIFDWAGTTVDYGSFAPVQAFMEVFKEYGVTPTVAEVREPMGMLKLDHIRTMLQMPRIRNCWKKVHGEEPADRDAQAMYEIFEDKLMKILNRFADPKPDTLQAVKKLRQMGIAIGSTTGYTDKMMEVVVPAAKAKGYAPDVWLDVYKRQGVEGTESLKKEIQRYAKKHMASYKYPKLIEFWEELPKTISGKIQHNKL